MDLIFDKEGRAKFDTVGEEELLEKIYRLLGAYDSSLGIPRCEETEFEQMLWKHFQETDSELAECIQKIKVKRNPLDDQWQLTITLIEPQNPSDTCITL